MEWASTLTILPRTVLLCKEQAHNFPMGCDLNKLFLEFSSASLLPLSIQAYEQLQDLQGIIQQIPASSDKDQWSYIWGNNSFFAAKTYKTIIGQRSVHLAFRWIWKCKCQMKHKVFFWLLIIHRLSTRDLLGRRNMQLESYTCDLCILHKRETVPHLFLRCNFAKACQASMGVSVVTTRPVLQIFRLIKDKLQVSFYMEIIIVMSWSIWCTRNDWVFNNIDPTVEDCKQKFMKEFSLLLFRSKPSMAPQMHAGLQVL